MNDDRKAGLLLIGSSVTLVGVLAVHPTAHDLLDSARIDAATRLNVGVHAVAVAALVGLLLGALGLMRRTAGPDRLSVAGFVLHALAALGGLVGAVTSGFVAPAIAREMLSGDEAREAFGLLFHYNGFLHSAFVKIHVIASSLAIAAWSLAGWRGRSLWRGHCAAGILLALALVLAVGTGHLRLHVHGFGLVVVLQGLWLCVAGAQMLRTRDGA